MAHDDDMSPISAALIEERHRNAEATAAARQTSRRRELVSQLAGKIWEMEGYITQINALLETFRFFGFPEGATRAQTTGLEGLKSYVGWRAGMLSAVAEQYSAADYRSALQQAERRLGKAAATVEYLEGAVDRLQGPIGTGIYTLFLRYFQGVGSNPYEINNRGVVPLRRQDLIKITPPDVPARPNLGGVPEDSAGSSKAKRAREPRHDGTSGWTGPSETRSSGDDGRERGAKSAPSKNGPPEGEGGSSASGSSGGTTPSGDGNYWVYYDVDGSKVTQSPDGGRVIEHPDGSKEVVNPGELSARERAEREQKQKEKKEKDEKEKPPEKEEPKKKDKDSDDDDDDDDTGGNTTRTDPDSPGASEGSPRRIQLPIVPSLADKFSRAMMELVRASAGGGGARMPWGGPTDGPSWTPFGPGLAYGDSSEGGGGAGNGGSGDGWGEGPMFQGESSVPRRLPTPLERMRAGMNFGRWNTLPGDPPPVDLRTARMRTLDDGGPVGSINTSAHEMYLRRFVNPVARVATRRRG